MDNNAPTYQEIEKDLSHQYWIDCRLGKGAYAWSTLESEV